MADSSSSWVDGWTVGKMTISPWIKDFHFPHWWQYGCYMTGRGWPHGHCPNAYYLSWLGESFFLIRYTDIDIAAIFGTT